MISTAFRASTGRFALCLVALVATFPVIEGRASADHLDVHVVKDAGDTIVLDYTIRDFAKRPAGVIAGEQRFEISLDRESRLERIVGAPALPTVNRSLVVPNDAQMSARIVSSHYYEVKDLDIAPSKGNLLRTVDPADVPYQFGPAYHTNAFYPGKLIETGKPYLLRDLRGVVVTLFPFQYNPVTRTLRVYDRVQVEVSKVGPAKVNPLLASRRHPSASFDQLYAHHFLNASKLSPTATRGEEGAMLIIAHDDWLPNLQPLIAHKSAIGIPTTAVGVSTIGNDATSIKAYIQNAFDTGGLSFVLLVGDVNQVATIQTSGWSGGASDPSYAKLAGDDDYPDILIGRFSAETAAQVDTQVARTVTYETLPATTQPWFKKGIGIGSTEGPGDDNELDYEHIDNIRADLLDYGYTAIDQIYEPSANAAAITAAVNDGRGIINYCGHGDIDRWASAGQYTNSNVNNLDNPGMLPFIVSVACNVGEFDGNTCFAETWLRATNSDGEPTGAVGFYGSSISQAWNPPMCAQDAVTDLLLTEEHFSLGALLFAGAAHMMDEYGGEGVTEYNAWHVFGDPSLRVFGIPTPPTGLWVQPHGDLAAIGNAGGPFTPASVTYTLENRGDTALDYTVSANLSWVAVSPTSGTLPGGGTADVTVSFGPAANALGNGLYEDTVSFVNTTDHDGDTTRNISLDIGIPEVQYEWPLDEDPGWTIEGEWAFGKPGGGGGEHGNRDPAGAYTGNNVYGYNLAGDYANSMGEQNLTTAAIDCSTLTKVSVRYWRWLGVEQSEYDHAYVRVSTDGATWTTLWENRGEVADGEWVQQEIDLSEIADGQETVYLRWTMGSSDDGWVYCGWNLDDITILGLGTPGCPDQDGDGFLDAECGGDDCNDADYDIRPNADEICDDNIDNNCDLAVDDEDPMCGGGSVDAGGGGGGDGDGGDCGCRVGGEPAGTADLLGGLLLGLGLLFARRRRRR